ncbi:TPA: HIT family protein [Streptococcus agalactiae]
MYLICQRINMIEQNENPYFVKEYETGYLVLGDYQYFQGYCLFLSKKHVTELHELPRDWRNQYLSEIADASEIVAKAFRADKMNIESLGNGDAHLHFHLFPRKTGDLRNYGHNGKGPVWWYPFEKMYADSVRATGAEIEKLKEKLLDVLG